MGCFPSKEQRESFEMEDFAVLASETPFSASEVESLFELYKKLGNSVVRDGIIHKEELQFALFGNISKRSLFVDRMFDLFDVKKNGHIEFEEFVHSFVHAFRLFDLRNTGYIEHEELKEMVLALLYESDIHLPNDIVEEMVDKTFEEADLKSDGKIDLEEWKEYVAKNPSLLKNMTLPYLMDITLLFPSFVLNTDGRAASDHKLE
ncbi:hypothetical protein Droror1_Dr00027436 [Drosera rotundifolia]